MDLLKTIVLGRIHIIPHPKRSFIVFCSSSVAVLVTQSCPTLWDPTNCSPPGFSVLGILQERILEWIAIPSPEDLPDPGIEPRSPALQADSLLSELQGRSIYCSYTRTFAVFLFYSQLGKLHAMCNTNNGQPSNKWKFPFQSKEKTCRKFREVPSYYLMEC